MRLRASPGANVEKTQEEVLRRLYRFINPLTGGADGKGWPFDQSLFVSDVYQCLQGTSDIQFIREVQMYQEILLHARPQGTQQWEFTADYGIARTRPREGGGVEVVPTSRFWLVSQP